MMELHQINSIRRQREQHQQENPPAVHHNPPNNFERVELQADHAKAVSDTLSHASQRATVRGHNNRLNQIIN